MKWLRTKFVYPNSAMSENLSFSQWTFGALIGRDGKCTEYCAASGIAGWTHPLAGRGHRWACLEWSDFYRMVERAGKIWRLEGWDLLLMQGATTSPSWRKPFPRYLFEPQHKLTFKRPELQISSGSAISPSEQESALSSAPRWRKFVSYHALCCQWPA